MPVGGWTEKYTVVNICNEILLSLKKEVNSDPWGHYAQWNKPVTKGKILHDSTYMTHLT